MELPIDPPRERDEEEERLAREAQENERARLLEEYLETCPNVTIVEEKHG